MESTNRLNDYISIKRVETPLMEYGTMKYFIQKVILE